MLSGDTCLLLSLNTTGQITLLNRRAAEYFEKGQYLQMFLHDLVSQREYIQMMAEVSQRNQSIASAERYCFILTTVNSNMKLDRVYQFAAEAQFMNDDQDENSADVISIHAVSLPRNFAPWNPKPVLSEKYDANTLQQHYVYEMSAIDKKENAIIATDYLGNIIYFDEAAERLYGWSSDEILGKPVTDTLCHPSSLEYGEAIMKSLRLGTSWSGVFMNQTKSGQPIRIYCTDYPIFDKNDVLIGIVGVSSKLEEQLASTPAPPSIMLDLNAQEQSALGLASLSHPDTLVWCSDNFAKIFQKVPHDLNNMSVSRLFRTFKNTKQGIQVETPTGWFNLHVYDLKEFNNVKMFILEESKVQKRLEVALKAAADEAKTQAFKTEFITTMSHEMRTPLHGIIAEVDNLEFTVQKAIEKNAISVELSKAVFDSMSIVSGCSKIQLHLVDNLLNLQKLASGKTSIDFSFFCLKTTLTELVQSQRCLFRLKNITPFLHTDTALEFPIKSDKLKITQIVLNFVNNALKYGNADSRIDIHARVYASNEGHDVCEISVVDCGPGIPEHQEHLLFTRFSQIGHQHNASHGSGLGLCICRQLAEQLSGRVWYQKSDSGGSCFYISFPITWSPERYESDTNKSVDVIKFDFVNSFSINSMKQAASNDNSSVKTANETVMKDVVMTPPMLTQSESDIPFPILVVEDNLINQKVMVKILAKHGRNDVIIANDGVEALEKFAEQNFSLILMDLSMPRMDGEEATKLLRQRGCTSLIIGVSANAMEEHRERCLKAGMDDFITKPIKPTQLKKFLASCQPDT